MYQLVPVHGDTGTIGLQPGLTDIGRETLGELGDAVLETIHLSRHAQVRLEGSRVLLTRLGSNPTGVRCRGAAWKWLAQHETVELADDTELALSKSKRLIARSTFVLRRTPTVGSEGASTSEPSGQPEPGVEAAPALVNERPPAGATQEPCKRPKAGPPRGALVIELSDGEDEPMCNTMAERKAQIDADEKLARQLQQQDEQMAGDEHQCPSSWPSGPLYHPLLVRKQGGRGEVTHGSNPSSWPFAASGSGWRRSTPLQSRSIHERIRDGWITWDGVEPLPDWLDAVR